MVILPLCHQMVKIFRLLVRGKYLVEKGEVVVIDEYFAKIKYQVLYHINSCPIKISYIFECKICITLLFLLYLVKSHFNPSSKVQKIRDMAFNYHGLYLIYNLIPLFCFLVGNPNASINSSFLRLNQLTCETPSILKSQLPSVSCLREQTAPSALKCCLNSEE